MSTKYPPVADWNYVFGAEVPLQRTFDVCCAFVALVLLAPAMLVIALVIWMESGRPIFFSQLRLGKGGRPFPIYKFRKFGTACGTSGTPLTLREDCRLTAVGRFLAWSKADELPQFWNVLKGDMSMVGPRPESLAFADCFSGSFTRLLDCKPGLFGPSQYLFRHEQRYFPTNVDPVEFYRQSIFPAKARIDLDYFGRRSFFGDLAWIVRGVLAVVGLSSPIEPELSPIEFEQGIVPQKRDGAEL